MFDLTKPLEEILQAQREFHATTNGGVIPDPVDARDYKAEELMGSTLTVPIDWVNGYDATSDVWPTMPNSNQEQQYSCTGRATAHYKQVLEASTNADLIIFSPKSIYNPIAQPGVGAYVRDAVMRTVNYGINKESTVPSEGTEAEITAKFNFAPFAAEAANYKSLTVANVATQDFDTLARMILLNRGFVSGWASHCQYFKAFGTIEGKKFLKTHGSYGPGSDMIYVEGMETEYPLFSTWTAIDKKHIQVPSPNLQAKMTNWPSPPVPVSSTKQSVIQELIAVLDKYL